MLGAAGQAGNWRPFLADAAVLYGHLVLPRQFGRYLPDVGGVWTNFAAAQQVKRLSDDPERQFAAFLQALEASAQPSFNFIHVQVPHMPWVYFPSGRRYVIGNDMRTFLRHYGLADDENLVAVAYQRYMLQLGFADALLGRLFDRLHETGLYERCLLVVLSDHGTSFHPGQPRRAMTPVNFEEILRVPLFVKAPSQQQGFVNQSNALTIDMVPTMATILGVTVPWEVDGVSLWDSQQPEAVKDSAVMGATDRLPMRNLNLFHRTTGCFSDTARPVLHDEAFALLDTFEEEEGKIVLVGWAADRKTLKPAAEILAFVDERLVFRGPTGFPRPDVADHFKVPGLKPAGFKLHLPRPLFRENSRVRIFARFDDFMTEVRYPVLFPWSPQPGPGLPEGCRFPSCERPQPEMGEAYLETRRCDPGQTGLEDPAGAFAQRLLELSENATRDGLFRFEPYEQLVEGSPSHLELRPWAGLELKIENPSLYERVDPESGFVPAIVKGSFSGAKLDFVAVAVNGKIANVMPTWSGADGKGRFQVILPETAFRPGKNEVEALAVGREGRRFHLKRPARERKTGSGD